MALQNIRLPRLDGLTRLVDQAGVATVVFSQWWNSVATQIENAINGATQAINDAATAQSSADTAQGTADGAQSSADNAQTAADNAQTTADSALALASTAVQQNVGPSWTDATGTASRTAYSTYSAPVISNPPTQAEVQAIADALAVLSPHFTAVVNDLKGNGALT
jgi:uncharacterized protein DUF3359